MKKNYKLLIALCIAGAVTFGSFAQVNLDWETSLDYNCLSVTPDNSGNTFFLSKTGKLSKIDQTGNVQWEVAISQQFQPNNYSVSNYSYRKLLAADKSGNVVVTTTFSNNANYFITTFKFDGSGALLWSKTYNSGTTDISQAVAVDQNGDIIVAGKTTKNGNNSDFLVIKYDKNGNQLWQSTYDGGSGDQAWDLTINNGDIYVAGTSSKFVAALGTFTSVGSFAKFSSEGVQLWYRLIQVPNLYSTIATEVKVDINDNVLVTGYATDQVNPNTGLPSNYSYFLFKFDNQGTLLWNKFTGSYPQPYAGTYPHLDVDKYGNSYLAGVKTKTAQNWDIGIWKYDANGSQKLNFDYSILDLDIPYGIATDDSQSIYITAAANQVSPLNWDYKTLKFNSDGTLSWSEGYDYCNATPSFIFKYTNKIVVAGGFSKPNNLKSGLLLRYTEPASLQLYTKDDHGIKNSELLVPIKAKGFKNIISGQVSVNWDPTVVTYAGVESFGLSGLDNSSFGTTNTGLGQLTMSWSDPGLVANNLADDATTFALRFKLTGNYGAQTPVTINGQPLVIEIVDKNFANVSVNTEAGVITIDPTITIKGKITYPNNQALQNVTVSLTGGTPQSVNTDAKGEYSFIATPSSNYSITPAKINDPNPMNGIDVQDIVLLRRHMLNVQPLTDPYQMIAADVNGSGTLSTLDIVYIQALILGVNNNFPNNLQWTFTPEGNLLNPANPFNYLKSASLGQVDGQAIQNFIGMKLGDINNNRDNTQQGRQSAIDNVALQINQGKTTGDILEIPIRARQFNDVSAYQFTLEWDIDKLEFVDVGNQSIEGKFGLNLTQKGILTTIWDEANGLSKTLNSDDDIFRIRFKKKVEDASYQHVNISGSTTSIGFYNKNLQALSFTIEHDEESNSGFELFQNYPNAFTKKTKIVFNIPEEGEVRFDILDELGNLVNRTVSEFPVGKNTVEWIGTNSQGVELRAGTYYLVVVYGNMKKVIKMIKIE